jgi:hypothetical protein
VYTSGSTPAQIYALGRRAIAAIASGEAGMVGIGYGICYVRDRRGVVRIENGPDGQRLSERVVRRLPSE